MQFKIWLENTDLHLATANDQGIQFQTGRPVTFSYLRGTEKAGYYGSRFQQDIEPAGRYMTHNENPGEHPTWETGEMTFQNPLVIKFNPVNHVSYDENSWKYRLHQHYGGKVGVELSKAIRQDGYDGIVTVGRGPYTQEIIDLTVIS